VSAGDPSPAGVARRLGHEFRDVALLRTALTHRSAAGPNNERLEFLGDAVLGMLMAEALYARDPRTPEGVLSRMRASLVNAKVLAEIGRELELGDALVLGAGELKSGGFRRDSILADTVEALVGAVFLDAGLDAARACVLRLYGGRLDALPAAEALKDPKTRLQELLQKRGLALPEYSLLESRGADHEQTFRVRCLVGALGISAEAEGRSRRAAEQGAAEATLESIHDR
jgi:ribonuclease-3